MPQAPLNKAQEAFLRLVRRQAYASALNALTRLHPADLAALFNYLPENEQKWFAESIVKAGKLPAVVSELEQSFVPQLLELIPEADLVGALQAMSPDDAVDILSALPNGQQKEVFDKLTGNQKIAVGKLLGFAPNTAGGIMTTDFIALEETTTVAQAIEYLRQQEKRPEIFYIYVTDDHQQLVGVVSFRELVLSPAVAKLSDIMVRDPVAVWAGKRQESVAFMIAKYNLLALPVVDEHHRLIGQITVDDAIDVLYEEASEDIFHLGSLGEAEHVNTPVPVSTKRRAPWLLINLGTAILAAATVGLFQDTISQYVVLAVLMPIIAGMGGNAGTQSLTVVVRGLALGEVDWSLGWKVLLKEVSVGFLNGALNGVVMGLIAWLWYGNALLGVIMFLAMVGNLVIAGLFGALVPLTLKKLGLDPALGSSIVVTTATDVGGFFVFLGLATLLLKFLVV
jgi:magnesium transporter